MRCNIFPSLFSVHHKWNKIWPLIYHQSGWFGFQCDPVIIGELCLSPVIDYAEIQKYAPSTYLITLTNRPVELTAGGDRNLFDVNQRTARQIDSWLHCKKCVWFHFHFTPTFFQSICILVLYIIYSTRQFPNARPKIHGCSNFSLLNRRVPI